MSMTFSFKLNPFGNHHDPIPFGTMRIHSAGNNHDYDVEIRTKDGWQIVACGNVPKRMPDGTRRSGHRNFLHLLRDILNDMDLDGVDGVGKDYVNVIKQVKEAYPQLVETSDYPDD